MADQILLGNEDLLRTDVPCDVLLATYNNADYIRKLIASIIAQSSSRFRLIIRDDGSTDDTVRILTEELKAFRNPYVLIKGDPSGSAKANFARLIELSSARYTLFADADDIWDIDKVEYTLNALEQAERELGPETPIYVYSDARVVDGEDKPIAASYWSFKGIRPTRGMKLAMSLVCAPMLGCASGSNRALNRLCEPFPLAEVTGHDWWMLLVATAFGEARALDRATLSYRQHGSNVSMPKRSSLADYAKSDNKVGRVRRGLYMRVKQARALITTYGDNLPPETRTIIERFVAIERQNFVRKRITLLQGGYLYPDAARNVAMLIAA